MELNDQEKEKILEMSAKMSGEYNEERVWKFINKHVDKQWYDDFIFLFRMITSKGYSISPSTWAIIAGALGYVLFPLDFIPDFIPGMGWIDDAFVLATVIAKLRDEIELFRNFTENK